MNSVVPTPSRYSLTLIICMLFVSGCSNSSDPNSDESQTTDDISGTNGDALVSDEGTEDIANKIEDTATDSPTSSVQTEPADETIVTPDSGAEFTAEPASETKGTSTTRVNFDITVPVYSSDALQVRLVWGGLDTTAMWNSDEHWTASVDFPVNTENQLVVTFSDGNGAITLGSVERSFKTGTNQSESLQIAANEFDTDRWDKDGDGVSNLETLIAGKPAQAVPAIFSATLDVMPTKTFRIRWEQSIGATYYQVLENETGTTGFVPVSANLPADALFYDHNVALFKSLNARYVVEACNASGCASSNELFVAEKLNSGIGVINVGDPDKITSSGLTISADGQTLAFMASRPAPTEVENTAPYSTSVYIYTLNAGTWQQQAIVQPNNADIGDTFGAALRLSRDGTILAVSAPTEDSAASGINGDESDNSLFSAGAAYIFSLVDGNWQQEAYIKANEPEKFAQFGRVMDLSADGETLVVTAPNETSAAAYVFTFTDSGWQQQAEIRSEGSGFSSSFVTLSENGNTLATGGVPHLFSRSNGTWKLDTILEREDFGALRGFGSTGTLSDDGKTLVITARNDTSRATGINPPDQVRFENATLDRAGGVHVFALVNGSWTQQAYIKPSIAENYTFFGDALSISSDGNTLAIASRENTVGTGIFYDYTTEDTSISNGSPKRTGSVYIYQRSVGTWKREAYVKPAQNLYRFWGAPVIDGSGDTLVVQGSDNDGLVFIY